MLSTRERTVLLDGLRPPPGYRLRRAVATSFTLDLMALLTVPVAFTFFDSHDDDGNPVADPVARLEALRRHAEKIALFCQAGAIGVPKPHQPLIAYLEDSVIEVQAHRDDGIFHPKVWVLNYEAKGQPAVYRMLCLSRNLTFARAWDTCLCLEGQLQPPPTDHERNQPIADLLRALPALATRTLSDPLRADLRRMAQDVQSVDFRPPEPFSDFRVHTLGLPGNGSWPFPESRRGMVVSPFLVGSTVQRLVDHHGLEVLVSRPEAFEVAIQTLGIAALPKKCYVLSPHASLDSRDADEREEHANGPPLLDDELELVGLHAKLFLFENGQAARLFTGSANATHAAFRQNVEVLVELVGDNRHCGIDAFLSSDDHTLRSLLQPYRPPESIPPDDNAQRDLLQRADQLARKLGAARLVATVHAADTEPRWDIDLSGELPEIPAEAELTVWPATLSKEEAQQIQPPGELGLRPDGTSVAHFQGLSFDALTAFIAFEITLADPPCKVRKRFLVTAKLVGAPKDRKARLLSSLLKDRRRALQLLLLLLMGEGADVSMFVEATRRSNPDSGRSFAGWDSATLLETLLRCLSQDPKRIDDAARLIDDLRRTPEGQELLPDGLDEIWKPVWEARQMLQS